MWLLCDVTNADELENCKNILSSISQRLIRLIHSLARAQIVPEQSGKYLVNVSKEYLDIFREFTTILPTALQNQYIISEGNRWIKVIVSKEVLKCMVSMYQVLELCASESPKEPATEEECRICYQQETDAINDTLRQGSLPILAQTITAMVKFPPLEPEKSFFNRFLDCYLTNTLYNNFTSLLKSLANLQNGQSLRNFDAYSRAKLSQELSLAGARLSINNLINLCRREFRHLPTEVIDVFKLLRFKYYELMFQELPDILTSFKAALEEHKPGSELIALAETCKNEFVIANLFYVALEVQFQQEEPQVLSITPTP